MQSNPINSKLRQKALDILALKESNSAQLDSVEMDVMLHELAVHQIELEMQNDELRESQEGLAVSRDQYATLFDYAPVGHCSLDSNHIIVRSNYKLATMLGIERGRLSGNPLMKYVHKEDLALFLHRIKQPRNEGTFKCRLQSRNGDILYVSMSAMQLNHREEREERLLLAISDITDSHKMGVELKVKSRAVENTLEGIMISGSNHKICYVNPAFEETTGYTHDEVIGQDPSILQSGRHDKEFYRDMWRDLAKMGYWKGEIWNRRKSGEIFPEWLSINAVRNEKDEVDYYVGVFSDITTQEEIRQRLHSLAYYDSITMLPNRHLLLDRIEQALKEAHREQGEFALLFMDLDRFKSINDTLGHTVGDQLLAAVAERLKTVLRAVDTVSRMGGDEFMILLHKIDNETQADEVAQKVLRAMNEPFDLEGHQYHISISIGLSIYPRDGDDFETLIKHADIAMYKAKSNGRNTYQHFCPDMNERLVDHFELENDLRHALKNGELELYYQPQIDLASGEWMGVEALLRWNHPTKGYIPPTTFIKLAEETGLIVKIGYWVIYTACQQFVDWKKSSCEPGSISINLSPHQFHQVNLVHKIEGILAEVGMSPSELTLELTESAAMPNLEYSIKTLKAFQSMGINISIDDFGTGFSSLSYLRQMPIDTLKIDRSFVMNTPSDSDDVAIVQAIIAMAKSLNLEIVAEGIETQQQYDFLSASGCHLGQGYLMSRPIPAKEIPAQLEPMVDE